MRSSRSGQTWVKCLLSLLVGLLPVALQGAPFLHSVEVTPAGENSVSLLNAGLNSGGGGVMTFRVNWGDGTPIEVFSYPATSTSISNHFHYYEDDPSGPSGDLYTISLSLSNSVGSFVTNVAVVITNVSPRLSLNVNTPINIGAPPTLLGLEIAEFPVRSQGSFPQGIASGPDGNVWFTETESNRIGKITATGVVTEYPLPGGVEAPVGIVAGSDNRLWFCAYLSGQIGAITTNGVVTMYTIPRVAGEPPKLPQYIVRGGAANLWYSDIGYRIGRITPTGSVTQQVFPNGTNPWGIALGFDNNIWFTDYFNDQVVRYRLSDDTTNGFPLPALATPLLMTRGPDSALWFTQFQGGMLGRITSDGVVSNISIGRSLPHGITTGPEGAIWFTERRSNTVARYTLDGQLSRYHLAVFSNPHEIVTGPDGALWFTIPGRDRIGRIRYTTAGNVLLSGNLNDPGYLDPHFVQINWGDGTPVQTLSLQAGINSFHVTHTYSGSQPFYVITVGATDDDAGASQASTIVVVNSIRFTSITRGAGEVRLRGTGAEGRTITIESSTDARNWSEVGTVDSINNEFEFVHPEAVEATRFYRGKLP